VTSEIILLIKSLIWPKVVLFIFLRIKEDLKNQNEKELVQRAKRAIEQQRLIVDRIRKTRCLKGHKTCTYYLYKWGPSRTNNQPLLLGTPLPK